MFGRKSREQRNEEIRQNMLKGFQAQFDQAQQCTDVTDKFLKLEEIKSAIDATDTSLRADITQAASAKGTKLFYATVSGGTAVGILALVGLHFPPLFILAGPAFGYYYGSKAGREVAWSAQEEALQQSKPFLDALQEQRVKVTAATDEIEKTHLREIAQSPRYAEVLKNVPRLRDQFAAAFGREVSEKAPEAPKKGHDGFTL
jgi:hypothetical protein